MYMCIIHVFSIIPILHVSTFLQIGRIMSIPGTFPKWMTWFVVILAMSSIAAAVEKGSDDDLFNVQPLSNDELSRTIYLNSSGLAYIVAGGAAVILIAAVGLYLYDYYYGTAKSDPIPGYAADKYYQQYYQDQSQYGQYAYADQSQYQRYVLDFSLNLQYNRINYFALPTCKYALSPLPGQKYDNLYLYIDCLQYITFSIFSFVISSHKKL